MRRKTAHLVSKTHSLSSTSVASIGLYAGFMLFLSARLIWQPNGKYQNPVFSIKFKWSIHTTQTLINFEARLS
jgi:hypothetical protein